ncbi:uncharacterized protein LOC106156914 [Lingula anatina]|uniref:Uncharacterized protein LOC106156914 n=1 Tax=Lingula anatina TaxID=7574 RepID=A0A2R2MTP8_LINAN|nr:uncharacterized protein LOC106156914 [Lingula anatina]|eukprot:XP_023933614.1 uncharacterized protein LOC106156914 [Lingula anatina]
MATDARSASKPRIVKLGTREVEFPSPYLQELKDSNHLLGDVELLRQEFHNQGYLFIRGLHSREEVLDARLAVLRYIKDLGEDKLSTEYPLEDGVLNPRCGKGCVPFMEGKNNITHSDPVRKVIEGRRPFQFFKTLIGAEPKTFDFKWLRAIHREGYTGVHTDYVYMSRGTHQLYTMWTPIGDVTLEMGTLCVCEGSHRLPGFKHFQETYGSCDIEKANLVGTGWFTNDPYEITSKFGGQWKTADFKAGDVLIFGLRYGVPRDWAFNAGMSCKINYY